MTKMYKRIIYIYYHIICITTNFYSEKRVRGILYRGEYLVQAHILLIQASYNLS